MTMNNLLTPQQQKEVTSARTQAYIVGAAAGLLFGLIAAYMYNRATVDYGPMPDGRNRVQTGDVLGLGLALLAVVRQVAEMGRGPEPKKGRR
jgi:hypothetical protein